MVTNQSTYTDSKNVCDTSLDKDAIHRVSTKGYITIIPFGAIAIFEHTPRSESGDRSPQV